MTPPARGVGSASSPNYRVAGRYSDRRSAAVGHRSPSSTGYRSSVTIRTKAGAAVEAARCARKWPVFSLTSFTMVRQLRDQGLRPTMVIDVGANRGQFTVAACELLRPAVVHSFEPLPDAGEKLAQACGRYPQVTIHRIGLGSAPTSQTLHVNAHSQSSSFLALGDRHVESFPQATTSADVDVAVERLDQVLAPEDIPDDCLLKIDAQGFEMEVIAGASGLLHRITWIIAELSFRPLYVGEHTFLDMIDHMGSLGFRFERPVGYLQDPATGEFLQTDALFGRAHPQ
jgi:FkbM family methyltransferase